MNCFIYGQTVDQDVKQTSNNFYKQVQKITEQVQKNIKNLLIFHYLEAQSKAKVQT